jgi:hypothetical protein
LSVLVLVVDDEPDVEALFSQHFRRDLRSGRLRMEFAMSAADALVQVARASENSLILILSDINMPGMNAAIRPTGAFEASSGGGRSSRKHHVPPSRSVRCLRQADLRHETENFRFGSKQVEID